MEMTGTWYPVLVGQTIKAGTPYITMDHRMRLRSHDPAEEDHVVSQSGYFPVSYFVPQRIPLLTDKVSEDQTKPFVGEINGVLGRFFMKPDDRMVNNRRVFMISKDGETMPFCHETNVESVVAMDITPAAVDGEDVLDG